MRSMHGFIEQMRVNQPRTRYIKPCIDRYHGGFFYNKSKTNSLLKINSKIFVSKCKGVDFAFAIVKSQYRTCQNQYLVMKIYF